MWIVRNLLLSGVAITPYESVVLLVIWEIRIGLAGFRKNTTFVDRNSMAKIKETKRDVVYEGHIKDCLHSTHSKQATKTYWGTA